MVNKVEKELKNNNKEKNGVNIIAFLCNWCSYAGADAAGTSRLRQPENIRIIRVPCSGRVNPLFILKAFNLGADGVLVSGCHPNDCHYSEGNFYARRRLEFVKEFLPFMGIDKDRFAYQWVSASEGQKWQNVVINFVKRIEDIRGK
jgi:coenzyme F420-reducing hydrogenase delta subunit